MTERRHSPIQSLEQALRASDDILELLPVATCVCDPHGRIVQYNRRAVELWGRAPQPGDTHEQFTGASRFYRPGGTDRLDNRMSMVLRTGIAVRNEEVIIARENGERLSVLLNIDPLFDPQGRPIGAIECFQDVTEQRRVTNALGRSQQDLRQQEQRWNATYEHAAIGIVEVDADGRFLRVNEAICGIIGLDRDELLGWQLQVSTHPDDRDNDSELYQRQVRGELDFYSIEKRFVRRDGRVVWCAIRSSTVRGQDGQFLYSVRVVQDITAQKAAAERQKLLIDELNHRVKNTLATVQSLAAQTARSAESAETFREAFEGRLLALSHAHDQLTRRHWASVDLRDIVAGIVAPYLDDATPRIIVQGASLSTSPRLGLTLALVLHELTTNAAKYGALSSPEGRIALDWTVAGSAPNDRRLRIEWREHDGPPVATPTRRGFGLRFIESSVASELGGVAALSFASGGLHCTIDAPLDAGPAPSPANNGGFTGLG